MSDSIQNFVRVSGSYLDESNDLNMSSFECNLTQKSCVESSVFITKGGITGIVPLKEYYIMEKTPTRIVAKYDGLASSHMIIIDLAERKATFKAQSNTNSSDFDIYELEDGETTLSKINN